MSKTRTCASCNGKHWPWQKCQATSAAPARPAVTAPAKKQVDPVVTQAPKKEKSYVGFPQTGSQFGFQSGLPFSRTKGRSRFAQEGFNEKTA